MSGSLTRKIMAAGLLLTALTILFPFSASCSKPPRPTADFTFDYVSGVLLIADPITGMAPLTVRFKDQSTGDITSWKWNLGDGTVVYDEQDFTHTYESPNSSGYTVVLTVTGPGGKSEPKEKNGIIMVYKCSEAANVELSEAKMAIRACLDAAGRTTLDAPAAAWDGRNGVVTAGGFDAADYLRTWKEFRAAYSVGLDGTIESGTDLTWGCVIWTMSITGPRWREK
ncbi:MAG: PKD domain-containing protein [Dehalococcoidia bacterium]|nr:PKD domain-containing protein [Dehalococcoidia bacterium]